MSSPEPSHKRLPTEATAISHVVARLARQFPGLLPTDIERTVHDHYRTFDDRPVRDFVPMLVERASREELRRGR